MVDASDEFGMVEFDRIDVSGAVDGCDDAVLSLGKLVLMETFEWPVSKPIAAGGRSDKPKGNSGSAGKTGCGRAAIECGTFPMVSGIVITRFL